MKMNKEMDQDNNWISTLALVVAFVVIRLVANTPMYAAWINFFSVILVLGVINKKIQKELNSRNDAVKVFEKQKVCYAKTKNTILIFLIIGIAIYSVIIHLSDYIAANSSVINDIISFVSIGISIEDDFIVKKITKYYMYKKVL